MKTISTEELRKQLENYSPESDTNKQRRELKQRNEAFINDITALDELSKTIEESTNRLTALAAELKGTHFVFTLPNEVKAALYQYLEDAATTAADAFIAKAKPLLKEMAKAERRISLPDTAAFILLVIFFWLAIFFALIVYANCQLWHLTEVWQIAWATFVAAVASIGLVIFLNKKHWL